MVRLRFGVAGLVDLAADEVPVLPVLVDVLEVGVAGLLLPGEAGVDFSAGFGESVGDGVLGEDRGFRVPISLENGFSGKSFIPTTDG